MTKILHIPFPFFQWRSAYFIPLTSMVLHIPYYGSDTKLGLLQCYRYIPHHEYWGCHAFLLLLAAFQSNFLRYPGRTSHSKHKPFCHAATSILLPQQMNGLSEANLISLPRQKHIAFSIFCEIPWPVFYGIFPFLKIM